MIVLALDTTTRTGSVAVVATGEVRWEGTGDPRLTHGERLPGELMTALHGAAVDLASVDLFAVAAGPGSFTGLRVGIAAMQGLAVATGRQIVPVSTLAALAARRGAVVIRFDRRVDGRAAGTGVRRALSKWQPRAHRTAVGHDASRDARVLVLARSG